MKRIAVVFLVLVTFIQSGFGQQVSLETLLKKMDDISSLPELNNSKTAMSSTWDRNGGNNDGTDFKRIEGRANILLDTGGPGYISRIFTGALAAPINESVDLNNIKLQVFIDDQPVPVIDCPARDFFTKNQFTAYPFVLAPGALTPVFCCPFRSISTLRYNCTARMNTR